MLSITSFKSPADCTKELIDGWKSLLARCYCQNPFYSPEMLLPAWEFYGNLRVRLLTVWDEDVLVALLPVSTTYNFKLFPVVHIKAWRYRHCFSCNPLLATGHEVKALQVLFDHVQGFGRLFSIYDFSMEGPMVTAISGNDCRAIRTCFGSHERACLQPARASRQSFQSRIRSRRLKEYRRQKKLLSAQGELRFTTYKAPSVGQDRLEAFLALEHAGWKGRERTALLSTQDDREFAHTIFKRLDDSGRLHVYEMTLDGRPVSMLLALVSDRELYTFKIAHDPEFDRYSPGVLLMFECSKLWEQEAHYRMIDSCATPGHSLVDRLWYERLSIGKVHMSGGDPYTRALVSLRRLGNTGSIARTAT